MFVRIIFYPLSLLFVRKTGAMFLGEKRKNQEKFGEIDSGPEGKVFSSLGCDCPV